MLELWAATNMCPLCSEVGGGGWGIKAWKELFIVLPAVHGHPHTPNPQAEKTWQEWQRRFPQEKSCRNKNEKADLQQQYYVQWIRWIHCIPKNTLPLAQRLKLYYHERTSPLKGIAIVGWQEYPFKAFASIFHHMAPHTTVSLVAQLVKNPTAMQDT